MRYCGQCGTQLDPQALTAGRCSSCGAAITPFGDILVLQPDPQVASAGRTTVPDVPSTDGRGLPTGHAQWPWEPSRGEVPASRGARRTMVIAGVCLIVFAVFLLCADAVLVLSAQ